MRSILFSCFILWLSVIPSITMAQTCLCLRCAFGVYKSYIAPSESMSPTLRPGDCFVAQRVFDQVDQVKNGDIITFKHPSFGTEFVKRIMAMPGDTIQIVDGFVWLNGKILDYAEQPDDVLIYERNASGSFPVCNTPTGIGQSCIRSRFLETLPNGVSHSILDIALRSTDNTPLFTVPDAHVFVLGDHRDNSTDSRIPRTAGGIGFVPFENIIGIVELETE